MTSRMTARHRTRVFSVATALFGLAQDVTSFTTRSVPAVASIRDNGIRPSSATMYVGQILDQAENSSNQHSSSLRSDDDDLPPPGLPSYLHDLSVGDDPLQAVRQISQETDEGDTDTNSGSNIGASSSSSDEQIFHPYTIERVSHFPPIYILRNFITQSEAEAIAQSAYYSGEMDQAETYSDNGVAARPNSTTAFLSHDMKDNPTPSAAVVDALSDEVGGWLLDSKGRDCWAEPLQVVRYTEGGQFVLHHDSVNRVVTALYFLNGVAGTFFPLVDVAADDGKDDSASTKLFPRSREEAIAASQQLIPGKDGVLVKGNEMGYALDDHKKILDTHDYEVPHTVHIGAGDAVAFYNLRWADEKDEERFPELAEQRKESGEPVAIPDWRALHAGLPVQKGVELDKWIANHWLHIER